MMNRLGRPLNRFSKGSYLHNHYQLYLFLLPALVYILVFQYWPIYGVQIAFKDFKPGLGIEGSPWVGLKHFDMFFNSYFFGEILGNTLKLSLLTLLFGFPIPILLALLLNQLPNQRYKRLVQTITYAPYFISTVVLCGMLYVFLSVRTGIFNHVIVLLGG
ncbi:MAG: sugar ABC transporter permease, partial [Clostridia bacterium]